MGKLVLVTFIGIFVAVTAKYNGPINKAGIDLIKEFDGFRANFQKNLNGARKIGYDHDCRALPCKVPIYGKYSVPLSRESAEALLREDLTRGGYESCVKNGVTYSGLTANQYFALVSFVFNVGCKKFRNSDLLAKLNKGNVKRAAAEFQRWVLLGGWWSMLLTRRRAAEKKLFCTGHTCVGSSKPPCKGTITARRLIVREDPYKGACEIVGVYYEGQTVTLSGRTTGVDVLGNHYWFKVNDGYISAYYVNIVSNNGKPWCRQN